MKVVVFFFFCLFFICLFVCFSTSLLQSQLVIVDSAQRITKRFVKHVTRSILELLPDLELFQLAEVAGTQFLAPI